MASDKRVELNNDYGMGSDDAILLIKNYISRGLPSLDLKEEYVTATGYWGIKYANKSIEIFIASGRGYLEWNIVIDGQEVILKNYDQYAEEVKASSRANIAFILELVKKVIIEEKGSL